ncbi:aminotransferase class V-fold PLP-dependent enzyme [Streptomyces sp. TRM64462]|uniref:pyridoxal phosphate-dependent decarboxylase family protein n=1 Tax=Streptomyces sp. TRM64462 TaxID=2741726 RepID=UPI00158619FE|nr:aminotransferase class V-fold PLP-dependent enzyme [Streptomyces sp. TRM64462]
MSPDDSLAGGAEGPDALGKLTSVVLDALAEGAAARGGPLPAGGPDAVAERVRAACRPVLPEYGTGADEALRTVVRAVTEGAADPADPRCTAHLHCPPLAVAAAADLAAAALNPSLDSWDQAPAATALEAEVTAALAALVFPSWTATRSAVPSDAPGAPGAEPSGRVAVPAVPTLPQALDSARAGGTPIGPAERLPTAGTADALVTTGGTESNLVALLLARERARAAGAATVQVVCGDNAHHSVRRAAWVLGLPAPVTVPCRDGRMDPDALDRALAGVAAPALVVATAGTTDEGAVDPLPALADVADRHGAALHVDAAYGGPLLFSDRLAPRLDGLSRAVSVTLDLHKLGWQPVAAGLLAVPDSSLLAPLALRADYLNADDDTEAGLPDLLGRSLRTTRRPDVLKIAATLRALGRTGIGALVEHCVDTAKEFAALVDAHPALRRRPGEPGISTVLFRPLAADALPPGDGDALVADVRRRLLTTGEAVVGRAAAEDADGTRRLWLKATLLHPGAAAADLAALLDLAARATADAAAPTAVTAPTAAAPAPVPPPLIRTASDPEGPR